HRRDAGRERGGECQAGEREIHEGSRRENAGPHTLGLTGEAARRSRIFLAEHPHEGAERNQVERVQDAPAAEAEESRRETDSELFDRDAGPTGGKEVAQLVGDQQDAQEGDDGEDVEFHALRAGGVLGAGTTPQNWPPLSAGTPTWYQPLVTRNEIPVRRRRRTPAPASPAAPRRRHSGPRPDPARAPARGAAA